MIEPDQASQVGSLIFAALAGAAAVFERTRSAKAAEREREAHGVAIQTAQEAVVSKELLKGKDDLISLMQQTAEAWKQKYEAEHTEFINYREQTHESNNKMQAKLLSLAEENSVLRNKTDLTPIMAATKAREDIDTKVITSLNLIITELKKLTGDISPN